MHELYNDQYFSETNSIPFKYKLVLLKKRTSEIEIILFLSLIPLISVIIVSLKKNVENKNAQFKKKNIFI